MASDEYVAALKRELAACESRVEQLAEIDKDSVPAAVIAEAKAAVAAVKDEIGRVEKLAPAKSRAKSQAKK